MLVAFCLVTTALKWALQTICQHYSWFPPEWLTLANIFRERGVPSDWPQGALVCVVANEGAQALALILGILIWLRPRRAARSLLAFSYLLLLCGLLGAAVLWSTPEVRPFRAVRVVPWMFVEFSGLLLPLAWLWFAPRAGAFRYPLRALIATTLASAGAVAALRCIGESQFRASGLLLAGPLIHRTIPGAGSAIGLLGLAWAIKRRPQDLRVWLMVLALGIVADSYLEAMPQWYNGLLFGPWERMAFWLGPALYLAWVAAGFVLASQEPLQCDHGSCCRACGYNLTGNVSGMCPECGAAA